MHIWSRNNATTAFIFRLSRLGFPKCWKAFNINAGPKAHNPSLSSVIPPTFLLCLSAISFSTVFLQIFLLLTFSPPTWTHPPTADWLQVCCGAQSDPLLTTFLQSLIAPLMCNLSGLLWAI